MRSFLDSRLRQLLLFLLLQLAGASPVVAAESYGDIATDNHQEVATQLKEAARLYGKKDYAAAADIYRRVSETPDPEQAAWALELLGACVEQLGDRYEAMAIYDSWLERYAGSAGEIRVKQRRDALLTAVAEPQAARRVASGRTDDTTVFGSASLMYRGMRSQVDNQDAQTPISSLAGDLDLHIQARTDAFLWRGRVSGGYLGDQSDRGDSKGRVSNLYMEITHEPSGAELSVGRRRSSAYGVYGYFDGASLSYPVAGLTSLTVMAGTVANSSQDSPNSDHQVYGLGTELHFPDPALRLRLYGVEQTYDGLTERRAVGGEISWFNDFSNYLLVADYDLEFQETNNLMFNGNWNIFDTTNLSLSLGYQRSPFLSATNALIGEYDLSLDQLVKGLDSDTDIYDAALERTALSRYASLVVSHQLSDRLRMVGEVFYYELSDLPQYDPTFETADSDANTTWGLQFILDDVLFSNDSLSTGARYTTGDVSDAVVVYMDEKLRLADDIDLVLRLSGSQRTLSDYSQDTYTVRPGVQLYWYLRPDLMLDAEVGYEWMSQDFGSENFQAQQAYLLLGLRKRF
jgi:tetratricopeptide (TPR) repeat protein